VYSGKGQFMKYKVLLTGRNRATIDEFFTNMYNDFECMTTSTRYDDIIQHFQYFKPDLFVYCIQNESLEDFSHMVSVKSKAVNGSRKIPIIIIGDPEECDEFNRTAVHVSNLTLIKPLTGGMIRDRIITYINQERQLDAMIRAEVKKAEETYDSIIPTSLFEEEVTRKHILVVDDDSRMLKVIKLHLHEKYDVATAISGKVALKFLETKKTDLILLDYEMPEENGVQVLEKLRLNPDTMNIPVIFLTGITDRKKIQNALVMKPQGYLLKPIDRKKLLATIDDILG
jgi:CheY-like chemotaxis protein